MRRFFIVGGALLLVLGLATAGIVLSGTWTTIMLWVAGPDHDFDPARAAPALDYSNDAAWMALPTRPDEADLTPQGFSDQQAVAPADTFFIHSTNYTRGSHWSSPLQPESATEENTRWTLANQASAFNGCCRIYAPQYRDASLYAYFDLEGPNGSAAMELAYDDVRRAFDYYLENFNDGRPFIIASHSQGSHHAKRLLAERVDQTALYDQLVAAYVIGGGVTLDLFERTLKRIEPCDGPTDLHCVVAWDTFAEGGSPSGSPVKWLDGRYVYGEEESILCINPLSWLRDGDHADASLNLGAVAPTGRLQIELWGEDVAAGIQFTALEPPRKHHTSARCSNGLLFVDDQVEEPFAAYGVLGSYHNIDYALFYMNIRQNAQDRVLAFSAAQP